MSNEVWKTGALSWSAINAGTASIANTDVIADGTIIYVTGIVNTSQKNVNYKVGVGGTTQFKDLPYKLPVYIEISSDLDLTSAGLGINGNCLIIHNTSATARTITLDGSTSFSLPAYGTATWRYHTGWTDVINASGVRFPATQITSSDPNTLDDYEEGTFSGTITFDGGNTGITYGTVYGNYTKKGIEVSVDGYMALTSKGTSTGAARIIGLPFVSKSSLLIPVNLRTANITGTGMLQAYKSASSSVIVLNDVDLSTGVNSNIDNTNFANNSTIAYSVVYQTV